MTDSIHQGSVPRCHNGDLDLLDQLGQCAQLVDEADCSGDGVGDRRGLSG